MNRFALQVYLQGESISEGNLFSPVTNICLSKTVLLLTGNRFGWIVVREFSLSSDNSMCLGKGKIGRMTKLISGVVAMLFAFSAAYAQTSPGNAAPQSETTLSSNVPSMPSEAEIGELLSKANEYVDTYKQTFKATKQSLDKDSNPGFYDKGMALCAQASDIIAMIKKNGSSAVALVSLIAVLDDMSLNGARASAETMLLAVTEDKSDRTNHAMQDFLDIAQAEKNCYDISELLFHVTIRYVSNEEAALRVLLDHQKQ
jgi:hypothetical protein